MITVLSGNCGSFSIMIHLLVFKMRVTIIAAIYSYPVAQEREQRKIVARILSFDLCRGFGRHPSFFEQ